MRAIGSPRLRARGGIGEKEGQAALPGYALHAHEQPAPFAVRRGMVAKDDTRTAWQAPCQVGRIAAALVGHQPLAGQGNFAVRHPIRIAQRVSVETLSAAPADHLRVVRRHIESAAARASRDAADITLIAISKTKGANEIRPLLAAGHRAFGENRVQEAAAKWPALRTEYPDVLLHLVGQLQSNKAVDAVALFDLIHSVDRPSLVAALGRAMAQTGKRPSCFVQVDLADEPQKGGCSVAALPALLETSREANLPIIGLMCVPPAGLEPSPWFALLAKLAADHGLAGLSMGMSGDYPTAVMLGATHVRVGTALFGERA